MPTPQVGIPIDMHLLMHSTLFTTRFALVLFALTLSTHALADVTDFQLNTDGTTSEHSHPRLAVNSNGAICAVWQDFRNGNADIYLQRFNDSGRILAAEQIVNADTASDYQMSPSVAVDRTGQISTVWMDYRSSHYPLDPDVYIQRLDSTANPLGSNRNLTSSAPDSLKASPDVALSPFGSGVVVWEDYRNKNWDIWGQRIAANGAPVGTQFRINDDVGSAQQHAPRVSYASDGWFVVTWYDNRWGDEDIFVQRFDSTGTRKGANIRVSAATSGTRQAFPDIAADDAGHFTVVWVDWRNGTYPSNPDIYSRRYDTLMTAEAERRVNTDASARAQVSPAIAADPNGNVAIVWADSGVVSWDIVGQMVDADGIVRETNFKANSSVDSVQVQPDVAVDGRNRYVVWADKRNGHFDIYGSINQYNDPHLLATPTALHFSMLVNSALPANQTMALKQVGYNPLHFQAVSTAAWLTVTPATGITPDTLTVSIVDGSLSAGLHAAAVTLIDTDNHDSSCVVLVQLEVQSPQIRVSPDTSVVTAFAGIKYPVDGSFDVTNSGTGSFTWSATAAANWLTLTNAGGSAGEKIAFAVCAESLSVGTFTAPIEVVSPEATNSPETAWVSVNVIDNLPYLATSPDSIFATIIVDTVHRFVAVVANLGSGSLNWTAMANQPWLTLQTTAGVAGDTVVFTVDPGQLSIGANAAAVTLTDSASFNQIFRLPVIIDYEPPPNATAQIGSDRVMQGEVATVPIGLTVTDAIDSLAIPLSYDSLSLRLDSVLFGPGLPEGVAAHGTNCQTGGVVVISFDSGAFPPGTYTLGDLYFTALVENAVCPIDSTNCNSHSISGRLQIGGPARVGVEPGEVLISPSTGVDLGGDGLPKELSLHTNYPNPFNLNTVIGFDLPARSHVVLEIFNLLGQQVAGLLDESRPAGRYSTSWDGHCADGGAASSGIYFYRLQADDRVLVRKMVLLK